MTLWVFGDSFSLTSNNLNPNQWMHKVAADLNTDVKAFGLYGSSLAFTFQKFNLARNKIQQNDILIINITGTDRQWFFKNYPQHNSNESPTNNNLETEAIDNYRRFLDYNQDVKFTYLLDFLYNVQYLTKKLNLHTIILINLRDEYNFIESKRTLFPLLSIASGLLLDISVNEFIPDAVHILNKGANDPRLNHLIRSNHLVLADKILNNIKNKNRIDLTKGFTEKVITTESFTDVNFIKEELFDNIVNSFISIDVNKIGTQL
jgi:hypothetical protein